MVQVVKAQDYKLESLNSISWMRVCVQTFYPPPTLKFIRSMNTLPGTNKSFRRVNTQTHAHMHTHRNLLEGSTQKDIVKLLTPLLWLKWFPLLIVFYFGMVLKNTEVSNCIYFFVCECGCLWRPEGGTGITDGCEPSVGARSQIQDLQTTRERSDPLSCLFCPLLSEFYVGPPPPPLPNFGFLSLVFCSSIIWQFVYTFRIPLSFVFYICVLTYLNLLGENIK